MHIEEPWTDRGCTIIELAGDLDVYNVATLAEEIAHIAARPLRLVLDMREVSRMDKSGLGLLLVTQKRAVADGGGLVRVACAETVAARVRLEGAGGLLRLCGSLEEALGVLAGEPAGTGPARGGGL